MPKRIISGTVIKKAGDKSATVLVERKVLHPRYHKTVKRFKKYIIHDEKNEANVPGKKFIHDRWVKINTFLLYQTGNDGQKRAIEKSLGKSIDVK